LSLEHILIYPPSLHVFEDSTNIHPKSANIKHKNCKVFWRGSHDEVNNQIDNGKVGFMDAQWPTIPDEVLEKILVWLSLRNLYHACVICKKWKAIILSPGFQNLWILTQRSKDLYFPFCVAIKGYKTCKAYSISSQQWHSMPIVPLQDLSITRLVVAGDGGLLCFMKSGFNGLVVWDPMLNVWKNLPCPENLVRCWQTFAVHMVVDPSTKHYKIIVAGKTFHYQESDHGKRTMYDSSIGAWAFTSKINASIEVEDDVTHRSIFCDGIIYWLAHILPINAQTPFVVLKYDVANAMWRDDILMLPNLTLSNNVRIVATPNIVFLKSNLCVIVQKCVYGEKIHDRVVDIFEFKEIGNDWVKITKEPYHRSDDWWKCSTTNCVAHEKCIYISFFHQLVVYNASQQSWEELTRFPFSFDSEEYVDAGVGYEPKLNPIL